MGVVAGRKWVRWKSVWSYPGRGFACRKRGGSVAGVPQKRGESAAECGRIVVGVWRKRGGSELEVWWECGGSVPEACRKISEKYWREGWVVWSKISW